MDPIEIELKRALNRTDTIPATELTALNDRIVQTFARKQKGFFRLMSAYLAAMLVAILIMVALFITTSNLKQCLLLGIGILIAFEGTVLIKLWFWIMHSKIATIREIKMLHLAVAELKTRLPAEPRGSAPAIPDERAPSSAPTPAAPAASKRWRNILVSIWLLALAGLGYWGWWQPPSEPRDVTPYFEKTIAAGERASEAEWQQSFEVTQARQHFYPRVVASGKAARVWISVSAEGSEPMYTGPVETGSRISFGRATPGRYFVKGRIEQADGDLTLRIGGVDKVPGGQPFSRLFFLMLSAAVAFALPIAWLQDRWLRRIDPELEGSGR